MARTTHKLMPTSREYILRLVRDAPDGYFIEIRPETRSLEQNERMWAMLDTVRDARVPWRNWQGQVLYPSSDGWKQIFLATLKKQTIVPGLDGELVVLDGGRSSKLTIAEMSDLMTLIEMFCAQRNIALEKTKKEKE